MIARTLFDKIWQDHVITELGDGYCLLHVSRHLMHDGGSVGLRALRERGLRVRSPELTFATLDHTITTEPGRTRGTPSPFRARLEAMREETRRWGVPLYDLGEPGQGIIHIVGPELA